VCAPAHAGRTHIIERSVRLCNLIHLSYLKALVRVDTFVLFRYESRTAANNFPLATIITKDTYAHIDKYFNDFDYNELF
jgi:hypothetical protein